METRDTKRELVPLVTRQHPGVRVDDSILDLISATSLDPPAAAEAEGGMGGKPKRCIYGQNGVQISPAMQAFGFPRLGGSGGRRRHLMPMGSGDW